MDAADSELTRAVHDLLLLIPRLDYSYGRKTLPINGVYVFFERGEVVNLGGRHVERIVRVGTHRKDGRFSGRIRNHFLENSRTSVFRRHLGGALLAREDLHDPRIPSWSSGIRPYHREVEEQVDQLLRDQFTFCAIPVADAAERLHVERGLIALLAQEPLGAPSPEWLGRHAVRPKIRQSGLWNTQHVESEPLDEVGLSRLRDLVRSIRNMEMG